MSGETAAQPVGGAVGPGPQRLRRRRPGSTPPTPTGAALYLLLGDQVVRYVDCIENGGVRVDEGYPRRLEQHFTDLPAEFESGARGGLRRARRAGVHLFKDGRTVSPAPGDRIVRRVDQRWGQLGPVLPSGTVDAAFVGLDGKTYLFSGDRYVRYTGADYSHVDAGLPAADRRATGAG